MNEPFWIIFASVLVIVIVFALLQEAMRDPVEAGDVEALEPSKPLPTGFGRAMLEQMPLPLLVISPRGRVVYGNKAAKEILPTLKNGAFAENIITRGFDLNSVKIGDRLQIGDTVVLEITQIGKECHNSGCAIKKATGDCIMPKEGIFSRVIQGGEIVKDLTITFV